MPNQHKSKRKRPRDPRNIATGARLRTQRENRVGSARDLAALIRQAAPDHIRRQLPSLIDIERTIRGHEAGDHAVGPRYRLLWSLALEMSQEDLFAAPTARAPAASVGTVELSPTPDQGADDEVKRRAALQLITALGMSAGTLGTQGLRHLVDLALTAEPRSLDDWHLACDDHLHAVRTRPPTQAQDDLFIDFLALNRQLSTANARDLTELRRVEAALSTLHANVLTRLGDHGAAIRWWRTAKAAADATGDLELRLGVRATEAGHGLMGQRSPTTVLRLTQDALRLPNDKPSLGHALVVCSQAKAFSAIGRHPDAIQAINQCGELLSTAPPPRGIMPGYWQGGQLPFAENSIYAAAGDEAAMTRASALHRLRSNDDYEIPTRLRLNEALCTVVNGGATEGARRAAEALDAVPSGLRSNHIIETGRTVLRAVPPDRRDLPAVRELRALTSAT